MKGLGDEREVGGMKLHHAPYPTPAKSLLRLASTSTHVAYLSIPLGQAPLHVLIDALRRGEPVYLRELLDTLERRHSKEVAIEEFLR